MAIQGYKGVVSISTLGTPTVFTDEATNEIGSTNKHQIVATGKRLWTTEVAIVVKDAGSIVANANIEEINYLFGYVRLASTYTPTGAITVSGSYFPDTVEVEGVHEYSLSLSNDVLDDTDYKNAKTSNTRSKIAGARDATMSMTLFFTNDTTEFIEGITAGATYLVEWKSGDSVNDHTWRAFIVIESNEINGGIDGLEDESITLNIAERQTPVGAVDGINYINQISLEFENID